MPAAFSTDLDVHRHWKALTRSVPLAEWYTDESSRWTLDYPPLFAYAERFAAAVAASVGPPAVLDLPSRSPADPAVVRFMRLTVLATDVVLAYAVRRYVDALDSASGLPPDAASSERALHVAALILFSPGLFLVDNVHFQYNGLVLGVLLLSIALFIEGRVPAGAAVFSVAINLKHTLLPIAPVIAVHIVSECVRRARRSSNTAAEAAMAFAKRLSEAALATLSVFALAWGPVLATGGKASVAAAFQRMFPFNRGLLHAYWAPNVWAVYAATDKALSVLGLAMRDADVDSASGTIGGLRPFRALPNITPLVCTTLILATLAPALLAVATDGRKSHVLPRAVAHAALSVFVFGWHVHEKAVLVALIPLAGAVLHELRGPSGGAKGAQCGGGDEVSVAFILLAIGGQFGLFPLIVTPAETPYKVLHYASYVAYVLALLLYRVRKRRDRVLIVLYTFGTACVELYAGCGGGHRVLFGAERLAFVPLMVVSVYSALGVLTCHAKLTISLLASCAV